MTVEQAKQRLLALMHENDAMVPASTIERSGTCRQSRSGLGRGADACD
jgi:hypothetical protein